jgi:Fic family protein
MTYKTDFIDTIHSLKSELDALLPMSIENSKRLKKKFRLEFNYNSNHIEGNTLTYGQTQLLLLFDKSSGDVPVSDLEEMKAHDLALTQIEEMAKDKERPLTEQFIRELNKMILVKPFWKDAIDYNGKPTRKLIKIGEYKETPNSVRLRNGEIHEYASPEETPVRMAELVSWYQKNNSTMHPVQLAAEFHYRFVCIHPFDDGNGRVARLVMNYILFKNDYPIVVIKSDDKENYLTALQKADTGNVLAIIEYIEKQAIWSLELSIKAAKGEDIEEYGDIDKEIELLKRDKLTKATIYKTPKVVDEIFHHVYDTIWIPLTRVLEKFNDFFAETQVPSYEAPVPIGSEISWSMYLLSLKSASKKRNVSIKCNLRFDDSTYTITIFEANGVRNHQILTIENDYKTLFMQADVDNIIRSVSNHLLETIKSAE